jgi:hypothetical protein
MSRVNLVSVTLLVFLLSGFSVAMGQAEQFLVGYWPFDEGSGKEAKDASGNGHDGELIDGAQWVQGKFEKALDFGAGGAYVVVPDDAALDLADAVTVMSWFNLNEAIAGQRRMMSKNNSIFVIFDFGNPLSLDFLTKPNNDFAESTTTDWAIGEWYHFAGTYDGDALRIYINGELEGEKNGVPPIDTSDLELWIGADDWQPGITTFPGIIDDVRIYSKALTQGEIKEAMQGPVAVQMTQEKLPITWGVIKASH